jgi:C2 domain
VGVRAVTRTVLDLIGSLSCLPQFLTSTTLRQTRGVVVASPVRLNGKLQQVSALIPHNQLFHPTSFHLLQRSSDPERSIRVSRESYFHVHITISSLGLSADSFALQVFGAHGLIKRELLSLPDPFAVLTVDGEQRNATAVFKKSLSPTWDEHFDM